MIMKIKFRCLICGRCNFDRPQPHKCFGGFRKRKLDWEKIILETSNEKSK